MYYLTDENELCVGYAVDNLEECKEAVSAIKLDIPKAHFYGMTSDSRYPKGCFFFVNDNNGIVYFNTAETGSENNLARHICKHGEE